MPTRTLVLIDHDSQTQLEEGAWGPGGDLSLAGSPDCRIRLRTLRGGESQGVVTVELCNGPLTLTVVPTRGMSIHRGWYRQLPLEWRSPVPRLVHPALVDLHDRHGLGWLNGFNELLVRCGLGFNGPPGQDEGTHVTLHGRIGNLPAHRVTCAIDTEGPGRITLTGVIDEVSMFGPCYRLTSSVSLVAGASTAEFTDEITNLGGSPAPLSLLYHINLGRPFLEAGARNAVACRAIAPRDARAAEGIATHERYEGPTADYAEQAYYYEPAADAEGWSTAVLHNAAGTAAFGVHYQTRQLPRFVVWKNTQSEAQGYVTGLEPAVNFPNFRGYERQHGRLPLLAPGDTYRAEMRWELADDAAGVERLLQRIASLQSGTPPTVHRTPRAGWSPAGKG